MKITMQRYLNSLLRDGSLDTPSFNALSSDKEVTSIIYQFSEEHPELKTAIAPLARAYLALVKCFETDGTFYLCGNGGSCADAYHISGELMKSLERNRHLRPEDEQRFRGHCLFGAEELGKNLEYGFRTVVLGGNPSLSSAVANDIDPDLIYAQHLFASHPRKNDAFMGISTSGNAANVLFAASVAKAYELVTIGLTGPKGGLLGKNVDISIRVPGTKTPRIQESGVPVYHALCAMVEARFFKKLR